MDSICISYRGPRGSGKRTRLLENLEAAATKRGEHFAVLTGNWAITAIKEKDLDSENEGESDEKNYVPYEYSHIHIGFDIARMSMQDKNVIKSILEKLGSSSQVMTGSAETARPRILVFYHAHLLGYEATLQIQASLETLENNLIVWFTSEDIIPLRIRDFFLEIPVPGDDYALKNTNDQNNSDWLSWFHWLLKELKGKENMAAALYIKEITYFMLQKNLRWNDMCQYLLDALISDRCSLSESQVKRCIQALASIEATSFGQTIPSYRIPILWQHFYIKLVDAINSDI
jgi:hypothetical protein